MADDVFTPQQVLEFARTHFSLFPQGARLEVAEIGDGNLNYIFRVVDLDTKKSVVLKQSGGTARISDQFKVSPERNRIEYEILVLYNDIVPGLVPKVFGYDEVHHITAMEDLSSHTILRKAYLDRGLFPRFADDISTFMARTLLLLSDVALKPKAKKAMAQRFVNPDCCEITEDLVFTEPFLNDKGRNEVSPELLPFAEKEFYHDEKLQLEAAKLKQAFLGKSQALIHGDLHTGSVFVTADSTKVIDPEFAFFGPAGFDLGNVQANLVFAWLNARFATPDKEQRVEFLDAIEKTIVDVQELFVSKYLALWPSVATDAFARTPGFDAWVLDGILEDAAGAAGLELARRTLGLAKVKELTSLDGEARLQAERVALRVAKGCILGRGVLQEGKAYLDLLKKALKAERLATR